MDAVVPSLFGLKKTNRDFTNKDSWGKNQFNSSFPAAMCCYLSSKDISSNYLSINNGIFSVNSITIKEAFGIDPNGDNTFFAFEAQHSPYQKFVIGQLPRTDLVIQEIHSGECLSGLEVKLTALPDNSTHSLSENLYGSEIVVRPDSIVYLACSLAASLGDNLHKLIPDIKISDWTDPKLVLEKIDIIVSSVRSICFSDFLSQKPFLIQPIWKTKGKQPELTENCLDIFIWSDAGFSYFLTEIACSKTDAKSITRQTRTVIWLFKMLRDIKANGHFNAEEVIDKLSFNTKNDKAFASNGSVTNKYMRCDRLSTPIIKKTEIKNIILGGGQDLLSPERRFDAILFNTPGLF
ncbi:HindVP family restriction endonuclease [Iodobacter fluviatilis]|uniref:Restriction endonuclease n=1 Tax=Iodobacter fluviatilis TaxID=537 RepID=A0A7G3GBL0_9NEIS|nr:HindVP family restriction endonuclease [Iodobacter fluviatilis]QBC44589.1 restriction endonuclease [Iodobacter fluviatilis]